MATWNTPAKATPIKTMPKQRSYQRTMPTLTLIERVPKSQKPKKAKAKKTKSTKAKSTKTSTSTSTSSANSTQSALLKLLGNPLGSVTGQNALDVANALQESRLKPVIEDYDRQEATAKSRNQYVSGTAQQGYSDLVNRIGQQLTERQQAGAAQQGAIQQAGAGYQAALQAGLQRARQEAARDAQVRGGFATAGATQNLEAANASRAAQGAGDTRIASQAAAQQAQQDDALLRALQGASGLRGMETQRDLEVGLNNTLRDISSGRSKALSDASGQLVQTLLDLRNNNQQLELAKQGILGDQAEMAAKQAIEQAKLTQTAKEKAADRASREAVAAANNKTKATIASSNNKTKASIAAQNNATKERIARLRRQASGSGSKAKSAKAKLADATKVERGRVNSIVLSGRAGDVKDKLVRRMVSEMRHGGLTQSTVNQYEARFGVKPPGSLKLRSASGSGFLGDVAARVADVLGG